MVMCKKVLMWKKLLMLVYQHKMLFLIGLWTWHAQNCWWLNYDFDNDFDNDLYDDIDDYLVDIADGFDKYLDNDYDDYLIDYFELDWQAW